MERWDSGLVIDLLRGAEELRLDLLRRLELMEREVRTLAHSEAPGATSDAVATLRQMENELRLRLAESSAPGAWLEHRAEILVLWRRYRRAFEELATRCRQRYPARPGRRERGPRW